MEAGTVMIVDSEARRLEATSELLRTHHYKTIEAGSESTAPTIASREKPDLILVQLGSDPVIVQRLAEATEVSGTLITVSVQRSFSPERRREVLSLKVAAFLQEDLPQDEFVASVDALIRQKRLIDELKRSIDSRGSGQSSPQEESPVGGGIASNAAPESENRNKISPLRDRSPDLYRALLSRYEEAVKQMLQHRIYKMRGESFEPFRQIARELFLADATARDALELHYQTLRRIAPAPDAPRAQAYLEVGRTTIIGLMGDLLTCYRDARKKDTFESKGCSNGLQERWTEQAR
jgi:DNA-binding NarL/FixJ family response regulator